MADVHGSPAGPGMQMPQLAGSGPAPVPYGGGRDQEPEPPVYHAADLEMAPADGYVIHGVVGLNTTQDPSAYDVNGNPGQSGLSAPYYAGPISPVLVHGDNDAGGRSPLSGTVAGAVANSTGRWQELQSDTFTPGPVVGTVVQNEPNLSGPGHPQQDGSVIGDIMTLPPSPLDPGVGSLGTTDPSGAFYDPPRGGAPQTFMNTGNEPG